MTHTNKKMAILSNTSSPSHVALGKLSKYGLSPDMFEGGLVSSGEECSKYVRETYCSRTSDAQINALWFTWNESEKQSPLQFLQCCETDKRKIGIVESVAEADFLLIHGSEVLRRKRELSDTSSADVTDLNFMYNQNFSIIDQVLEEAASRNLPMVCANPDLVVTLQGGIVANMPGQIAQRYEELGGTVTQFGKPDPKHFISCLHNLGISTENTEHISGVAHVGDSLEHDILGANAAGIDSIFVIGGIHAKDLGLKPTGSDCFGFTVVEDGQEQYSHHSSSITKSDLTSRLQQFFDEKGIQPTHVVPSLSL